MYGFQSIAATSMSIVQYTTEVPFVPNVRVQRAAAEAKQVCTALHAAPLKRAVMRDLIAKCIADCLDVSFS